MSPQQALLQSLRYYSSGDNCQPFRFTFPSETSLEVFHEHSRAEHWINRENLCSYIALGSLLAYVDEYFQKIHTDYSYQWHSLAAQVCLRIEWQDANLPPEAPAVFPDRHTDRRIYKKTKSFPVPDIEALNSLLGAGVSVHALAAPMPTDLLHSQLNCDAMVWDIEPICRDLLSLVHTKAGASEWGLHYKSLDLASWQAFAMGLLQRHFPVLYPWFRPVVKLVNRRQLRRQFASSGALLLFSMASSDPKSWLELGRGATRVWADLNARAYALQPMSIGNLTYLISRQEGGRELPELVPYLGLIDENSSLLKKYFSLEEKQIPAWLFRVGLSEPGGYRNGRLDLEALQR